MLSTPVKEMVAKDKRKYFSAKTACGFYLPKTTSKHSMLHTHSRIKINMPTCLHANRSNKTSLKDKVYYTEHETQ